MEKLVEYNPPEWAKMIKNIPKYRTNLGHLNTPIHKWQFSGIPEEFQVSVKRDDMTGSGLSGNKVRKLEFLLADAVSQKCDCVMTCGFEQSNHCRATAIGARRLGLTPYLLKQVDFEKEYLLDVGNIFLDRVMGSKVVLVPKESVNVLNQRMEKLAEVLEKNGLSCYVIPKGGSNHVGIFGYIAAFQELIEQNIFERFDDIVMSIGSGGTASGIAIANYLTGSKLKCHAISVSRPTLLCYSHIDEELRDCGLTNVKARDIIDITDEYLGKGYAQSTNEELDFILQVAQESGVILDRTYLGKAVRGMVIEMQKNPQRFKGSRVLFLHTGGIFGLFDGGINTNVSKMNEENQITKWENLDDIPVL